MAWRLLLGGLKLAGLVGLIAATLSVYASMAPPSWPHPSLFFAAPRPALSGASIASREPILDADQLSKDRISVRVVGEKVPASRKARDRAVVVFFRLSANLPATWHLGESIEPTGSPSIAYIPASAAANDNWELLATGLTCDQGYSGNVEVVAVSLPRALIETEGRELLKRSRENGFETIPGQDSLIQSNIRTIESLGVTPGALPSPYRQLAQLSPDISVEQYRRILGPEVFRQSQGEFEEIVFANGFFFTYLLVDQDERVLFFSVTVRDPEFRPVFAFWSGSGYEIVRLGSTKFAEAPEPDVIDGFFGANFAYYNELSYFGGPGLYQHYLLGSNAAGPTSPWDGLQGDQELLNDALEGETNITSQPIASYRGATIVNTFGVGRPHFDLVEFINEQPDQVFIGGVNQIDMAALDSPGQAFGSKASQAHVFAATNELEELRTTFDSFLEMPEADEFSFQYDGTKKIAAREFSDGSSLRLVFLPLTIESLGVDGVVLEDIAVQ